MKNKEKLQDENNDILKKYTSKIYDEEVWINKEVGQIAEVTYAYEIEKDENGKEKNEGPFFNITLFEKIGGLNSKKFFNTSLEKRKKLLKKAQKNFLEIVSGKINQIEDSVNELENEKYSKKDNGEIEKNNYEIFELKKDLLLKSLKNNKLLLEASIIGLPFELQKAGLEHNLSEEEITQKCDKLDKIDEICFGEKISKKNNKKEIIISYVNLRSIYEKNKGNLNQEEIKQYEKYLTEIEKLLPKGYKFEKFQEPEKVLLPQITNRKVERNKYISSFNHYIKSHNIRNFGAIIDRVDNITDTEKSLRFPDTQKAQEETLERILKLMAHESDGHTINLFVGNELIGFRGDGNIEKEEGIAKLLEHLFIYGKNAYKNDKNGNKIIDLEKIKISPYHPKLLLAELLNGEEQLKFLELHEKIDKDNMTPLKRFLRQKRNRPLDKPGCQHKDTTYTRGILNTARYINDGNDFFDLFLGKFNFDDLKKVKRIKELREKNGEKLNLPKPSFIYEKIYFKMLKRLKLKEYGGLNFIDYLKEKYPFIDFGKLEIQITKSEFKKRILKILKLM